MKTVVIKTKLQINRGQTELKGRNNAVIDVHRVEYNVSRCLSHSGLEFETPDRIDQVPE